MFAYKVVVALAFLGIASAELLSFGSCPNNTVTVVDNFNVTQYLGKWFEFAKYPTPYENGAKCVTAQYGLRSDGNVSVTNSQFNMSSNEPTGIVGYATPVENAKLNVVFPVSQNFNATTNYWVVGTDYTKFSVVYSCRNVVGSNAHATTVWILTRERVPTVEVVDQAKNVMMQQGFYLEPLVLTTQDGCF